MRRFDRLAAAKSRNMQSLCAGTAAIAGSRRLTIEARPADGGGQEQAGVMAHSQEEHAGGRPLLDDPPSGQWPDAADGLEDFDAPVPADEPWSENRQVAGVRRSESLGSGQSTGSMAERLSTVPRSGQAGLVAGAGVPGQPQPVAGEVDFHPAG